MSDKNKNSPLEDDDFGFIETGDADDADFAFEGMPDAPSTGGSADGFDFAEEDEFGPAPSVVMADADHDPDDAEDGFADDAEDDVAVPRPDPGVNSRTRRAAAVEEESEGLFGDLDGGSADEDEEGVDEDEEYAAPAAASGGAKGKMIFYGAVAAAVLGVGFVTYNFVLPQVGIGPLVASSQSMPAVGTFDESMPTATPASVDELPGADLPAGMPPALPMDTAEALPSSDAPGGTVAQLPADGPTAVVGAALGVPDSPSPVVLPPASTGRTPVAASGDVADLRREIETLVRDREAMREKFDSLEKRFASLEKSMPDTAPLPMVEPPAKPEVVENWTLKGVQKNKGIAWLEGPSGFQEVRSGDAIDGVGTVKDITRYENAWVVVTTNGVILQGE